MWTNNTVYQGPLKEYHYPTDKEVGSLLVFLKKISTKHRVYLLDVPRWNLPLPPDNYDIYIICMFGESVDTDYVKKLDQLPDYENKKIILLTSQFYKKPNFNRIKTFYIEHLHTVLPFLPKVEYTQISKRKFTHGVLSNRNAIHKTVLTVKLLNQFDKDLQYSFCNTSSNEYRDPLQVIEVMSNLGINLGDETRIIDFLQKLHQNPVVVPGHNWSIKNRIYQDSQLIWTAESIFLSEDNDPTSYITEKLLKSIISGSPFVSVAQKNTLERLKLLGFETYEKEFGINYDNKADRDRYISIFNLIDNFDLKQVLLSSTIQDLANFNHNYFYTNFYKHVENNNTELIDQMIEYVNAL